MKSVLLIDDDSVCNFLSIKTLERMGIVNDIHIALNGKQALDLFKDYYQGSRKLPDIILLDLNMPVMDGFGFLEGFKNLNLPDQDQVKIVIVSSSQSPKDMLRARVLGVTRYISKPIKEDHLRMVLACA